MLRQIQFLSRYILVLVFLTSAGSLMAQSYYGYNWYFGNSTNAVRFSRSTNLPVLVNNKAVPFGTGGSAVGSDRRNGDLLFYTDGNRVFDVNNAPMPNGSGLIGAAAENQPVAITGVPGVNDQYYIFHRRAAAPRDVLFSIVDMKAFGSAVFPAPPSGNVTTKNNASLGLTGRSEAMIAVPHANQEDYWLITHASGSTTYDVTLVTDLGVFNNTTFTNLGLITEAANFSYHPASGRIAVCPREATRDIEILNFDNATGILSITLPPLIGTSVSSAAGGQAIYDTEWSSSGQYLYISRHGAPGIQADVFQFDVTNPLITPASVLPQPNTISRSFGLQMGPDSVMYHLYRATAAGPFLLAAIDSTDTVASEVVYRPQAFGTNLNFNATQFPAFTPKDSILFTARFTYSNPCSNATTTFFPEIHPGADSLRWEFDTDGEATDWSPVYTFTADGNFNVTLTAYLNNDSVKYSEVVVVKQFDAQIDLVTDTTVCSCQLRFPRNPEPPCPPQLTLTATVNGAGSTTNQWYGPSGALVGQTTTTLTPDSAGYYYIVVTDASTGCTTYAGVNIKEYGVQDQRANIWHFGETAGIDFNFAFDQPPTAPRGIVGPLTTPEGSATISDRNGQVVFSTDGRNIFDREGTDITPAPVTTGLGGEPGSTQSAIIIPVPGDETLYYIFTTQEVYGANTYELRYSLFDVKLNNGLGGLSKFNELLFTRSTERITSDGTWLIAHEYGNNSFRAYQVSATGLSNPVISGIGSDHTFARPENGQGYMELNGNRLAVALSTPGVSNFVEIFDFDGATGIVSNFRKASLNNPAGQAYGLEFSGNKLLVTLKNPPTGSQIIELFFDAQGIPHRVRQTPPITVTQELGAIQRGPDGQIYVAVNNATSLGTIQVNPDTLQLSTFNVNSFPLAAGTRSRLGLPNFIQIIVDPLIGPSVSVDGQCEDDSVRFSATGRENIDTYLWSIRKLAAPGAGVIATSTEESFAIFVAEPGAYEATVTLSNPCDVDLILTRAFTIFAKPLAAVFPNPAVICTGTLLLDGGNPADPDIAALTYLWTTTETTRTITVDRQAFYNVTSTNPAGCSITSSVAVTDNRPILDLGPDITICQNAPIAPLDALNPGLNYQWTINGVNANTTQTQSVSTTTPGVFTYAVTITDPVTSCTLTENKVFTINAAPTFTTVPTNNTTCGANGGSILLTITGPAGTRFSYLVAGPSPSVSGTDQAIGVPVNATNLLSGAYAVSVTDQVSGCAAARVVPISDNNFTATAAVDPLTPCDPLTIIVTHNSAVPPTQYTLTDVNTLQTFSGAPLAPITATTFRTMPVPSGMYQLQVVAGGCTFLSPAPFNLQQQPQATITGFTSNTCITPIEITVNGSGTVWSWTGPPTIVAGTENDQMVRANTAQGPQTFTVTSSGPGLCPITQSVTVNVTNNVVADFTASDACADQVTLTAVPSTGSYTYRWFRAGVLIPGGNQITIGLADNGVQYRVDIVDATSGCVFNSPSRPAIVAGDLIVSVATTNPCTGSPFTLTATVNQPTATFRWTLNGDNIAGQTGSTLTISDGRQGTFAVIASVGGCSETAEIAIFPAPNTPGNLFDNALICPEPAADPSVQQVVLDPGTGFLSYDWFKDNVTLNTTTQTFIADEPGLYRVDLINVFLCPSSDQTTVDVECDPKIMAPSAFRPASSVQDVNGDLVNKEFRVFTYFIDDEDFQVFIFNRWGEMVYQSSEREFRWNGGYNNNAGQLLPAGTYTYLVKYKSEYRPEDGVKEKRGGVMLVR